ncbi:DUF2209 family protein [Halorutilales archaeon Cl-col2-1]
MREKIRSRETGTRTDRGSRRVAVDISGRHEREGRYLMVCAAVSVDLTSDSVDEVNEIEYSVVDTPKKPGFDVVVDAVSGTVGKMSDDTSTVVAEEGEFYNKPDWVVEGALGLRRGRSFKYIETISERKAVGIAHHAAYGGRKLLIEYTDSNTKNERPKG